MLERKDELFWRMMFERFWSEPQACRRAASRASLVGRSLAVPGSRPDPDAAGCSQSQPKSLM